MLDESRGMIKVIYAFRYHTSAIVIGVWVYIIFLGVKVIVEMAILIP